MQDRAGLSFTRRDFIKSAAGVAALGSLAACESLGLNDPDEPLFDGPTIDEDDFIAFNSGYYGVGVDSASQLPFSFIRDGAAIGFTDPVAIAFRLQHLLSSSNNAGSVETILDHILAAQIDDRPPNNYRNMIPRLVIQPSGIVPATKDYSFHDNALLASRVAMAAQAYPGTGTADKAHLFLENQRLGYNEVLAQSQSGFLPVFGNAGLFGVDPTGMNLLFGGFYDAVAFVLGYLIGDTPIFGDVQPGLDAWQAMIDAQNALVAEHPASTRADTSIQAALSRNGSGYQYFHALLALESSWLDASMSNALYNVLYSYLDAALYDRIPGIYSAGPHSGGFYLDNGLNRLAAKQRYQTSRETIVTADALAAAMRLFDEDSDERLLLRGWIGLYASVDGVVTPQGYFGGITKTGAPVPALYARQSGAMILFKSRGARLLNAFMNSPGRPTLQQMFGQVKLEYQDEPIVRVDAQLPVPIRAERLFTRQT